MLNFKINEFNYFFNYLIEFPICLIVFLFDT